MLSSTIGRRSERHGRDTTRSASSHSHSRSRSGSMTGRAVEQRRESSRHQETSTPSTVPTPATPIPTSTSTPAATAALPQRTAAARSATGDSASTKAKKTFMDRWVEPPVLDKPSYRDHGGSPCGVLEHMQPLGELPNARVKARVKPEIVRRSTGSKAFALDGARDTPEGTPAAPDDIAPPLPLDTADDDKDADFAPGPSSARRNERPTRAGAAKRRSTITNSATTNTPTAPSTPTKTKTSAKTTKTSKAAASRHFNDGRTKQIVAIAKTKAIEAGKPDTAAAVGEVYEQSLNDPHLTWLLDRVLSKKASQKQITEFQEYVKVARRKLKAAKEAALKLASEAANGAKSVVPPQSQRSAPSLTSLAATAGAAAKPSNEPPTYKTKLSLTVKNPQRTQHARTSKMTKSPAKRAGSADSDSSLTSMTSNEDDVNVGAAASASPLPRAGSSRTRDTPSQRTTLTLPAARGIKRSSAEADLHHDVSESDRLLAAKKQKLSEKVDRQDDFPESNVRQAPDDRPSTRTRAQRDARHAAFDHASSSPPPPPPPPPPRHVLSRAAQDQLKPAGRKAKIKQSPEKKNISGYSTLSGVGGAAGLASPIGADDNEELSENNDFCSACGASGFLLCCDGCDRSFHFACLDPPLHENASELNEPWYCYICVAKRPVHAEQADKVPRGLFAPLLNNLRKRNPSNFGLPVEIRDYFEGVGADKQGNFIDAVHTKPRNRAGYDEAPDYTRIKDAKGNSVLCYSCSKTSGGTKPILQCDFCGQHWHLDCLDPPLANPPALNMEGKKVHDWMCPLHADQELRKLDTSLLYPRRRIHMRKPRNARIVDTSLRRGFRNNGVIEVVDDATDSSDSEFYDEETQDESVVYRLPASGIKLDFIDKVKNTRVQQLRNESTDRKNRLTELPVRQLQQANFARRSFRDQQAALNLAQFASANRDLGLDSDQVESLLATLIAEAPADVADQMAAAEDVENALSSSAAVPPSPPASEQTDQLSAAMRKQMQMLQELIRRRLENAKT